MSSTPLIGIVEDDTSLLHALIGLVRALGYRAAGFESAEQFLASPQCDQVDCVTTDIQMGAIDGFDLTQRLAMRRPGVCVIIITARADVAVRARASACGAICVLHKPFEADTLGAWLAHALAARAGDDATTTQTTPP